MNPALRAGPSQLNGAEVRPSAGPFAELGFDAIAPSQYYDTRHQSVCSDGEHRLTLAVLKTAISDFLGPPTRKRARGAGGPTKLALGSTADPRRLECSPTKRFARASASTPIACASGFCPCRAARWSCGCGRYPFAQLINCRAPRGEDNLRDEDKLMECRASAVWDGNSLKGKGAVTTENGALRGTHYVAQATKAGDGRTTNSAELIAAAHAASFSIALSDALDRAGFKAERIVTTATVTSEDLSMEDWTITGILLDVVAKVPAAKVSDLIEAAVGAKTGCSIGRLLNTNVSLNARLEN
jgi:lipoyl-dependent peroxiredoxin